MATNAAPTTAPTAGTAPAGRCRPRQLTHRPEPRSTRRRAYPMPFFEHHQVSALDGSLLAQLCREWVALNADPASCAAITSWGLEQPALTGFKTPGAVLDELVDGASPERVDAIAHALLERVRSDDQLAGRVLLQSMLPCLVNVSRRSMPPRGTDHEEQLQRVLAEFWSVIGRPTSLPHRRVLARLQLDTLHRVSSHRRSSDAWEEHTTYQEHSDHEQQLPEQISSDPAGQTQLRLVVDNSPTPARASFDPEAGLYELVLSARAAGVITPPEAQFLVDVYLNGSAEENTLAEAARRLGLSHTAVRQRCTRLRSKLVDAVLSDLGEHGDDQPVRQAS